jgi:hypothetical protein
MPRLRKAWSCRVKGYDGAGIYYAENQGKARMQCFRSVEVCDLRVVDITVRRAPEFDKILPDRHWLLEHMTDNQKHIVLHSIGGDTERAGYRDYFYGNDLDLHRLTFEFGLMRVHSEQPDGIYFELTAIGREVAMSMVSTYPRA